MSRCLRSQRSVHTAQTLHHWHFGLVDFRHVPFLGPLTCFCHARSEAHTIWHPTYRFSNVSKSSCRKMSLWRNTVDAQLEKFIMTHKGCLAQFSTHPRVSTCFAGLPAVSSPGTAILMNSNLLHCGGANLPAAMGGSRRRLFYVAGFANTYLSW